jgi:hypothetical protein
MYYIFISILLRISVHPFHTRHCVRSEPYPPPSQLCLEIAAKLHAANQISPPASCSAVTEPFPVDPAGDTGKGWGFVL